MGVILREAIKEALLSMDCEATVGQIKDFIDAKYKGRWKDVDTAIADLTYPGNKTSTYRPEEKILERVERGKYRLRLQSAFPKEVLVVWRRGEGGNLWGELLGVFSDVGFALEAVKGKQGVEYHFELYPMNKLVGSKEVMFFMPHWDKQGLLK
jgi:hypothetical protein